MTDEHSEPRSVDDLPDDPLKMPPPYWRGCGAIIHLTDSLRELEKLMHELVPIHAVTEKNLASFYANRAHTMSSDEERDEEFLRISEDLWSIEIDAKLKAELACLMCAIQAEDELNRFAVFNLHKEISDSIERLSSTEKLLVVSAALGHYGVKGTTVFEGLRKLVSWRNAFAHGHCVDRPTKSLRHNHLISPDEYPGVPSALRDTLELVESFLKVSDYLRSISTNKYTGGKSWDVEEVRKIHENLSQYSCEGGPHKYSIERRTLS